MVIATVVTPLMTVLMCAVLLGMFASLFGQLGPEVTNEFFADAIGEVVGLHAKMLLIASFLAAVFFIGSLDWAIVVTLHLADRLTHRVPKLVRLWSSMWSGRWSLFRLPTTPTLRFNLCDPLTLPRVGYIAGESPQLE